MKVLFVNPIGQLGGAERALLDSIASLKDFAPAIATSVLAFAPGPLLEEAAALGAATSVLQLPGSVAALGDSGGIDAVRSALALTRAMAWAPALTRRLRTEAADIIHTNGFKAHALVALARPSQQSVVWHLHDFISSRPLMRRVLPLLRSRASVAIAVSEAVAEDARTVLKGLPVVTVLNAVRTTRFDRGRTAPADLDSLAGLPPSQPGTTRIGLVATFATWKGHDVFLRAAHALRGRRARFYLVGGSLYATAGSQQTVANLRRQISALGIGDYVGMVQFQRDISPVLAALDIVVHASTKPEPFGRVVAEGMSAGLPVVAAASGGILEQLEDGRTGLLFPMGDSSSLTERLARLLDSPELGQALGRAAAEHARVYLDAKRLGRELLQVYDQSARRVRAPAR